MYSPLENGVVSEKHNIELGCKYFVGNVWIYIFLWNDRCLCDCTLAHLYPALFAACYEQEITVAKALEHDSLHFPI
jgi:hypothetical protein